uniref:DNA polymerase n=1 Tax=Cladobotryum mycophilum TaxID=491253 RepID=A0A7S8J246_9HYPO|nr:DNA polymerase [Cladobotryum mycophilum]QPD06696.1 DNA polymerase [Cladobotryum mycophilum]
MHSCTYFSFRFCSLIPTGEVRSCYNTQISHIDDYEKLYSKLCLIFQYEDIFDEISGDSSTMEFTDKGYPIGDIIFDYRPIKDINNTKYTDFIPKQYVTNDNKIYKEDKDISNFF